MVDVYPIKKKKNIYIYIYICGTCIGVHTVQWCKWKWLKEAYY